MPCLLTLLCVDTQTHMQWINVKIKSKNKKNYFRGIYHYYPLAEFLQLSLAMTYGYYGT